MALFDRPYATFDWSAIANLAQSCRGLPFSSFLTLNNIVTLKSELGSLKVIKIGAIQKLGCGFSFAFLIYGAVLYRLRLIGRKPRKFYTPPVFIAPAGGDSIGIS